MTESLRKYRSLTKRSQKKLCEWCSRSTIYGDIKMKGMKQEDCRALETLEEQGRDPDLQHPTSSESCRSSMVDYDEEMTREPPRKRPVWPEWEETRGREEDAWRLEPEGETEVQETVIVADEVEGTNVDSNGEVHHKRGNVKNHRSQSGVPGGKVKTLRVRRDK